MEQAIKLGRRALCPPGLCSTGAACKPPSYVPAPCLPAVGRLAPAVLLPEQCEDGALLSIQCHRARLLSGHGPAPALDAQVRSALRECVRGLPALVRFVEAMERRMKEAEAASANAEGGDWGDAFAPPPFTRVPPLKQDRPGMDVSRDLYNILAVCSYSDRILQQSLRVIPLLYQHAQAFPLLLRACFRSRFQDRTKQKS